MSVGDDAGGGAKPSHSAGQHAGEAPDGGSGAGGGIGFGGSGVTENTGTGSPGPGVRLGFGLAVRARWCGEPDRVQGAQTRHESEAGRADDGRAAADPDADPAAPGPLAEPAVAVRPADGGGTLVLRARGPRTAAGRP